MRTFHLAAVLTAVGILGLLVSAVLENYDLALALALRVSFLVWLGLVIGAAWLLEGTEAGTQTARISVAGAVLLLALGLVTPVLDGLWHATSGERWIVRIPKDDLAVLKAVRETTPEDAVILQKPAMPFLSKGPDAWAAAIGGRMVYVSPRATHWANHATRYDQARAFFEEDGALPDGGYGYIYVSRALNPGTYDGLVGRLSQDAGWRRKACFPDACLWEKAPE